MTSGATDGQDLRRWLLETALPIWWTVGADRRNGGFHEKIDLDGTPVEQPHRARVAARQVFSFCEGGRLGWTGPWRQAASHALNYLRNFVTPPGTVASLIGLDGRICAPDFDLYNQAFALLAFAYGHHVLGEDDARDRALALRSILTRSYAHSLGGFYEGLEGPARLPLRSNPHMHLLEAALAWAAVDGDPGWRDMADAIAKLCLDRFIDPLTGALREYFAADWSPAEGQEGQIAEPGHQYEWAFLLAHWAELTGRERPAAVSRLIAFADAHGVDPARGVAVNAVLLDGGVHDAVARLWPQTERLRAYTLDNGPDRTGRLVAAIAGLRRYLDTPMPGLWFDQLRPDDTFVVEPAPASSLYHIVGAVVALEARG